jgi:hypothetical protein
MQEMLDRNLFISEENTIWYLDGEYWDDLTAKCFGFIHGFDDWVNMLKDCNKMLQGL